MFDPSNHCLFSGGEMHTRFVGWEVLRSGYQDFPAPHGTVKSLVTVIARKPELPAATVPLRERTCTGSLGSNV